MHNGTIVHARWALITWVVITERINTEYEAATQVPTLITHAFKSMDNPSIRLASIEVRGCLWFLFAAHAGPSIIYLGALADFSPIHLVSRIGRALLMQSYWGAHSTPPSVLPHTFSCPSPWSWQLLQLSDLVLFHLNPASHECLVLAYVRDRSRRHNPMATFNAGLHIHPVSTIDRQEPSCPSWGANILQSCTRKSGWSHLKPNGRTPCWEIRWDRSFERILRWLTCRFWPGKPWLWRNERARRIDSLCLQMLIGYGVQGMSIVILRELGLRVRLLFMSAVSVEAQMRCSSSICAGEAMMLWGYEAMRLWGCEAVRLQAAGCRITWFPSYWAKSWNACEEAFYTRQLF